MRYAAKVNMIIMMIKAYVDENVEADFKLLLILIYKRKYTTTICSHIAYVRYGYMQIVVLKCYIHLTSFMY